MGTSLKFAVGKGKPNRPEDVAIVQHLINANIHKLVPLRPITEDRHFGPRTEVAVMEFQKRVVKALNPDGIVDPNGKTLRALMEGAGQGSDPPHVTAFIQMALPAARSVKAKWHVPIAVVIAQSAQETGWGRAVKGNAYFGIKGKAPGGASTAFGTTEVINGKVVHIKDEFRAYKDYADSADDYGRFLNENARYKAAFTVQNDPIKFVEAVAKAGYATDPNYAKSLTSIIRSRRLDQYDR